MRSTKQSRNLARAASMINTLGGGSVSPFFKKSRFDDHYRVEVSLPSIDLERVTVEVKNDRIFLLQSVREDARQLHSVLGTFEIAPEVVVSDISARPINGKLVLILPCNEMYGGWSSERPIQKP